MDQPDNYYSVLGVTKATTDLEVRQAYNVLVESLRSRTTPDTQLQSAQRKQLLDEALHTLLTPDKRKRHDEKLDWHLAKSRVAADRAREAELRLKQSQEAALELRKAALAAEQQAAQEAAQRAAEEARRREELARVEAEAAERFRQLREERNPFVDTVVPMEEDDAEEVTQVAALAPPEPGQAEDSRQYVRALVKKALIAAVVFLVYFFITYLLLRQTEPKAVPLPVLPTQTAPTASAPALAAAASAPDCGSGSENPCPAQTTKPDTVAQPEPQNAGTANQAPTPAAPPKPTRSESAKSAEQLQYQKVLRRVEEEHPELNPERPGHRPDLVAFVAGRVAVHVKEGYPRSKALDIAVRDLETQEQTKRMLEKFRSSKDKPQPEAAPVLDKGEHQGYDPKCRWVTPEQWSCK